MCCFDGRRTYPPPAVCSCCFHSERFRPPFFSFSLDIPFPLMLLRRQEVLSSCPPFFLRFRWQELSCHLLSLFPPREVFIHPSLSLFCTTSTVGGSIILLPFVLVVCTAGRFILPFFVFPRCYFDGRRINSPGHLFFDVFDGRSFPAVYSHHFHSGRFHPPLFSFSLGVLFPSMPYFVLLRPQEDLSSSCRLFYSFRRCLC